MNTRQRAPPRHANTVPGHSDARFCPGCGKSPHNRTECSAWGKICFKCDKRNHFANVCRSTAANTNLVVNVEQPLSQTDADLCNDTYALNLYNTNTQHSDSVKPYVCTINVCSTPVILEIDTGSSVTLLSHTEWARIKEKAPKLTLDTQNVPCLRTYSGHTIQPLGRTLLDVYHNDTQYQLYALVVPGTGPNLLGRDWLSVLQLNWAKVHRVDDEMFLEPYKDLFTTGLGKLEGVTAKLYVDETVQPRYCKPRPVPLAMRAKVESELDRLQEEGVIRPVEFSEWAAPIVPVLKASGDIRICGDYKVTINQAVKVDKYPIPNIDDLFTKVSGGQLFTTLDLRNAYQQVVFRGRVTETHDNKYNKGSLRVCASSVWCLVRAWHISAHYGTVATEHSYDGCVPRRHSCLRVDSRRARQKSTNSSHTSSRQGPMVTKREVCFQAEILQILGSRHR